MGTLLRPLSANNPCNSRTWTGFAMSFPGKFNLVWVAARTGEGNDTSRLWRWLIRAFLTLGLGKFKKLLLRLS